MNRLKNKTIIVTAGYGDIGRATCRRCCEEGATVIMTGRKSVKEGAAIAQATQSEAHGRQLERLSALGVPTPTASGRIEYRVCDSARRDSIDALFADVRRDHPRVDVVIGNAALVHNEPFLDLDPGHWQETLDLNLTGQFHLGQAAARTMTRQEPLRTPGCERGVRGKILFNGSWVGDMPWAEGCSYAVAKAGLKTMVKAMANELAAHGIRVNVMAPGIVMAGLSKKCYENDPKFGPRTQSVIPLREFGTVDQCADAFLFLASDEADYITGTTLLVDGGASIPRRD
ncbi:MAG TPA: SDR family oxidoreductase [Planctomycetota bacterium]|nr:SDR family oxidoreductase [Planctomycetota bacterium]